MDTDNNVLEGLGRRGVWVEAGKERVSLILSTIIFLKKQHFIFKVSRECTRITHREWDHLWLKCSLGQSVCWAFPLPAEEESFGNGSCWVQALHQEPAGCIHLLSSEPYVFSLKAFGAQKIPRPRASFCLKVSGAGVKGGGRERGEGAYKEALSCPLPEVILILLNW